MYPPEIVLIDPHYYQFLNMASVVPRQRRIEVDSGDLVFIEIGQSAAWSAC